MKKIIIASLPLLTAACTNGATDKAASFSQIIDTHVAEFHSALDVVIMVTFGVISLLSGVFG